MWERDFGFVTGGDKGMNANVLDHYPEIRDSVGFGGGGAGSIYMYSVYTYIYMIYVYLNFSIHTYRAHKIP